MHGRRRVGPTCMYIYVPSCTRIYIRTYVWSVPYGMYRMQLPALFLVFLPTMFSRHYSKPIISSPTMISISTTLPGRGQPTRLHPPQCANIRRSAKLTKTYEANEWRMKVLHYMYCSELVSGCGGLQEMEPSVSVRRKTWDIVRKEHGCTRSQ